MGVPYSGGTAVGCPNIDSATCTSCGQCAAICPIGCLRHENGAVTIHAEAGLGCIACGHCMMVCPSSSIRVTGRGMERSTMTDLPPIEGRSTFQQLQNLMLARRTVRQFTPEEVSREMLDQIVAAAATAPMGFPPSDVGIVVFHGREKVHMLANEAVDTYRRMIPFVDNAIGRLLMRLWMAKAAYRAMYGMIVPLGRELIAARDQGTDAALYDAPAALLFHASPFADGADLHLPCTYAMLAAEAMGLGTAMIGCVPGPLARRPDVLRKYGIPKGNRLGLVLIIGHPAVRFRRAVQRSFASVCYA